MDIYLDTSHLQKWQQGTLSNDDLNTLNKLKSSGKHSFVISPVHIFDITERTDTNKAIEIGQFIDHLPKKWLRNSVDLKRVEIKDALKNFKKEEKSQVNPFVDKFINTFEPNESTLKLRLDYSNASMEIIISHLLINGPQQPPLSCQKQNLETWASTNYDLVTALSSPQNRDKEMQRTFRRSLKKMISDRELLDSVIEAVTFKSSNMPEEPLESSTVFLNPLDIFIEWLIKKPSLIPSIWCPYYTQHYMHRTDLTWKISHIYDLAHLAALPYVNYLSIDRQMLGFTKQALTFARKHFPVDWEKKPITSIDQIKP
ncbi:hypothetical protein lpari_02555 [Legionella parisiensis]|uniref:Uncharacterized protein n=1 Tax=Legionella parisiensis TaxID=45071 RepID=A0A1E5JNV0_9GAMM|nr:hypothetical protein [Legionella parisiensis]OEH46217.1 hypothetical protein lpari_02555 [Legionella parisiensis]